MFSLSSSMPIFYFDTVDSTIDMGWRLESALCHGTIIITGHQTKGRGRFARNWEDLRGKSVLMTVFLHTSSLDAQNGFGPYSLQTALAVIDVLTSFTDKNLLIKWPNDVLLVDGEGQDKKIAGVLLEVRKDWLAVGIGINITAVPPICTQYGTSIFSSNQQLNTTILAEHLRDFFCRDAYGAVWIKRVNERLCWKEKWVRSVEDDRCCGILKSVNEDGSLLLEHANRKLKIYSGSITNNDSYC